MTLQEAKEYFSKDFYAAQQTGIVIEEVSDSMVKCSLHLDNRHMNAAGKVMGGVFFTLADYTFAIATNSKNKWTVTTTSQINYLSQVKGNTLYSECTPLKEGKSLCTYQIKISDNTGILAAIVISSGMHLK